MVLGLRNVGLSTVLTASAAVIVVVLLPDAFTGLER
jgi:hypothetical protein